MRANLASDRVIHDLIRRLSGADPPKALLDKILDAAVTLTGATNGSIILIDRSTSTLSIEASRGFADRVIQSARLKVGEGITGWVAAKAKTLRVADVRKDKRYVNLRKDIRSELASPLILDRKVIGVINVDSTRVNAFSEEDEAAIESLATLSSRVVGDALIHDRLKKRSQQLEALVRIGGELTSLVSPQRILDEVTAAAAKLIDARLVAIRLLDPTGQKLTLAAVHGGSDEYPNEPPIPAGGSALGSVAVSQIPLIIEDIARDPTYRFKERARKENLHSMLAVPLVTGGRSLGVLAIYRSATGDFEEDSVTITIGLAGLAAAALENARLFQFVIDSDKRIREAEMRNAAKEMTAELAHKIRNPLTVARLLVGAGRGEAEPAITSADRRVIVRELDRIDELITRLLGNAGKEQARFQALDLDDLLDEIVTVCQVKAARDGLLIRRFGTAGATRGDRNELWQAFTNIIDNATHFARKRIHVRANPRAHTLRADRPDVPGIEIVFSDDGPGVSSDVAIFDPLVTTREGGVGIGLFTARRILLEHGGDISYSASSRGSSDDLGGAAFRVWLPHEAGPRE